MLSQQRPVPRTGSGLGGGQKPQDFLLAITENPYVLEARVSTVAIVAGRSLAAIKPEWIRSSVEHVWVIREERGSEPGHERRPFSCTPDERPV